MAAMGSSERIFDLIAAQIHFDGEELEAPVSSVQFDAVCFAYPTRHTRVLDQFSMTLEAGQMTALVGPSGGGKSTVVSLLVRFYEPSAGRIIFNGIDGMRLNPSVLRHQ
eukprot:gene1076-1625_t